MHNSTYSFSASAAGRILTVALAVCLLAVNLAGCKAYLPDTTEGAGYTPLFDPDGNDDPAHPTEEVWENPGNQGDYQIPEITSPGSMDFPEDVTEATEEPVQTTEKETEPPVYADPVDYAVVIASELNVRSGPDTTYERVDTLAFGVRVGILGYSNDWCQIQGGWVHKNYIYIEGDRDDASSFSGTVKGDAVNVRQGPGTNYKMMSTKNSGDRVDVLFSFTVKNMKWGYIRGGWICLDYVLKDGEQDPDATSAATEATGN